MLPDWVSNPGPLTYESGALPIALRGPAGGGGGVIYFLNVWGSEFIKKSLSFSLSLSLTLSVSVCLSLSLPPDLHFHIHFQFLFFWT